MRDGYDTSDGLRFERVPREVFQPLFVAQVSLKLKLLRRRLSRREMAEISLEIRMNWWLCVRAAGRRRCWKKRSRKRRRSLANRFVSGGVECSMLPAGLGSAPSSVHEEDGPERIVARVSPGVTLSGFDMSVAQPGTRHVERLWDVNDPRANVSRPGSFRGVTSWAACVMRGPGRASGAADPFAVLEQACNESESELDPFDLLDT